MSEFNGQLFNGFSYFGSFQTLDWIAFVAVVVLLVVYTVIIFDGLTNKKIDVMDEPHYTRYIDLKYGEGARKFISKKDLTERTDVEYYKVATTAQGAKVLTDKANRVVEMIGQPFIKAA